MISVPPLPYGAFVAALARGYFVLTDSGGVQEEAPAMNKSALVLRTTTERSEGIEAGWRALWGPSPPLFLADAERLLADPEWHARMAGRGSPYGDGHAAERIVRAIAEL
ncbi:MAG TPA: UDP-N-acetylglucosamine 2-epimerase [Stellaceae bacterium]|nr:UDP-N-acetylglucosamine 2-epimerase [Stellaceae bacterium]